MTQITHATLTVLEVFGLATLVLLAGFALAHLIRTLYQALFGGKREG